MPPVSRMTDFFLDIYQASGDGAKYHWELREGEMNEAFVISDGNIKTSGYSYTVAGARRAARKAKRRVLKYRKTSGLPREKI